MAFNVGGGSSISYQEANKIKKNRLKGMRRSSTTIFTKMFDLEGRRNEEDVDSTSPNSISHSRNCSKEIANCGGEEGFQKKPDLFLDGKYYEVTKDRKLKEVTVDMGMTKWWFGAVLDPRTRNIKNWNRVLLISSAISTVVDPMFLYLFSINSSMSCLFVDSDLAITVTVMRLMTDAIHFVHMFIQLRLAYLSKRSLIQGEGELVFDARKVCRHYVVGDFWFDFYIFIPFPPLMVWYFWPYMITNGVLSTNMLTITLVTYLGQYLPKLYHVIVLIKRLQDVTGYVFHSAWGGFAMNVTAFFICAHVAGSCWYLLAVQQVQACAYPYCQNINITCLPTWLTCPFPISSASQAQPQGDQARVDWGQNDALLLDCMNAAGSYDYGIYKSAVHLMGEHSWLERSLYPIFWGIMTLSTFGNALTPSNKLVEIIFSILVVTCGLLLFSMLIGNIQMFLHDMIAKKEDMQLRVRELEWWMRRRQIPKTIQERVNRHERHRWGALRGIDEDKIISNMPQGLRRDIQRHLCLGLVKQVPLFHLMEDRVLDNVCEHLKRGFYMKGEMVYILGEPLTKMVFVYRGHLESSFTLNNNQFSVCILGPGHFFGDELLSWSLRMPFAERLPPSTATVRSLDSCEVFTLDNQDLHYVVDHFRSKFEAENLRRVVRFYSPSWRMWAAVTIQSCWRRFKAMKALPPPSEDEARKEAAIAQLEDSVGLITSIVESKKRAEQKADAERNRMSRPQKPQDDIVPAPITVLGEVPTKSQRDKDINLISSLFVAAKPPDHLE